MKKLLFFIIVVLPGLFFSCSEEIKPEPNTYSDLLTGEEKKTWHLTAFTVIDKTNQKNSFRLNIENSCEDSIDYYDNYYTFYKNTSRTLEITEGPDRSRPSPATDRRARGAGKQPAPEARNGRFRLASARLE